MDKKQGVIAPDLGAVGWTIGKDGMPTDPKHPFNREDYVNRTLDSLKRAWLRAGMLPALADAIMVCREHNRPLPEWAALAAVAARCTTKRWLRVLAGTLTLRRGTVKTPFIFSDGKW